MADENSVIIQVELDSKSSEKAFDNIQKAAEEAGGKVSKTFKTTGGSISDAFSGVGGSLIAINQGLELADKAIEALKKVGKQFVESIKQAEQLKLVNQQFEILSTQAGIASDSLRNGLEKAAGGLVDTDDLLKAANKSLIELGSSASEMPKLFELARKASNVFGGDVVQNFESINSAIASGNARGLRNLGIIVDQEKAYKTFADSLGITTERLSLAGKQQALLNAVLERGKTAFSGIDEDVLKSTNSFKAFEVSLKQFNDALALRIESIFGGTAKKITDALAQGFKSAAEAVAPSTETIADSIVNVKSRIDELNNSLKTNQKVGGGGFLVTEEDKNRVKENISFLEKELKRLDDIQKAAADDARKAQAAASRNGAGENKSFIQLPTAKEIEARQAEITQTLSQTNGKILQQKLEAANAIHDIDMKEAALDALDKDKREQATLAHEARLLEIKKKFGNDGITTKKQFNDINKAEEESFQLEIEKIQRDSNERKMKDSITILNALRGALVSGISQTASAVGVALAKGQNAFEAFTNGITALIGDMLIAIGNAMIGIGVAKLVTDSAFFVLGGGAAIIAAGAGLVALGAAFKAANNQAAAATGGGTSGAPEATTGGGSTSGPGENTLPDTNNLNRQGPSINLTIQGNVLDRRQTGLEIVDILQDAFDTQGARVVGAF